MFTTDGLSTTTGCSPSPNSAMDMAWSQMKSFDDTGNQWLVPVFLLVAIAMTVFNVWRRRARKKRRQMY